MVKSQGGAFSGYGSKEEEENPYKSLQLYGFLDHWIPEWRQTGVINEKVVPPLQVETDLSGNLVTPPQKNAVDEGISPPNPGPRTAPTMPELDNPNQPVDVPLDAPQDKEANAAARKVQGGATDTGIGAGGYKINPIEYHLPDRRHGS